MGESGSGKSVTAQAIMGLTPIPPGKIEGGKVTFKGHDLIAATEQRAVAQIRGDGISMIFQDPMTSLNPSMTHRRADPRGPAPAQAAEPRARAVRARSSSSASSASRNPRAGSASTRISSRAACASASSSPSLSPTIRTILLADEPTTALDVTIQCQIFRLIREIQQRFGMAMILITHDLGLVAGIADRILVMYGGRIVEEGPPEQIFYNPQHPYTVGLLQAVPKLTDTGDTPLRTIEGLPPVLIDPPDACAFAGPLSVRHAHLPAEGPRLLHAGCRQPRRLLAAPRAGSGSAKGVPRDAVRA